MRGFTNTIRLIRAESINEKKYGITTSSIKKSNSTEFFHYQGAGYLILFRVLEQIAQYTKQFDFVDIGCGKGRPIFVAESLGYKILTGIDLDGELIDLAKQNLKDYLLKASDSSIQFIHINALEYNFKNTPTVYFLFNPFNEDVLKKVVRKVISSTNTETWFVYMNPKYAQVFTPKKFDLITEVKTKKYIEAKLFKLKS